MNEGWWTDEVQDELAFVIGGAVTLDEESVRKEPNAVARCGGGGSSEVANLDRAYD